MLFVFVLVGTVFGFEIQLFLAFFPYLKIHFQQLFLGYHQVYSQLLDHSVLNYQPDCS